MPVLFLVIRIQSVCRKAILICLIPIVAGVFNCGRFYHVYGGITIFEGSAPQNKGGPDFLKSLYCTTYSVLYHGAAFSFCGVSTGVMHYYILSSLLRLILTYAIFSRNGGMHYYILSSLRCHILAYAISVEMVSCIAIYSHPHGVSS